MIKNKLTEKEKTEVKNLVKKYKKILGLDIYDLTIEEGVQDDGALAECVFRYPYLDNTIRINVLSYRKENKEKREKVIIHELCHVITDPLYSKANSRYVSKDEILDEREKLTDCIANIVYKLKYDK
jgi:hypothetical protein